MYTKPLSQHMLVQAIFSLVPDVFIMCTRCAKFLHNNLSPTKNATHRHATRKTHSHHQPDITRQTRFTLNPNAISSILREFAHTLSRSRILLPLSQQITATIQAGTSSGTLKCTRVTPSPIMDGEHTTTSTKHKCPALD